MVIDFYEVYAHIARLKAICTLLDFSCIIDLFRLNTLFCLYLVVEVHFALMTLKGPFGSLNISKHIRLVPFQNFFQMDVKSVFLNSYIQEEVYVDQSPDFKNFSSPNQIFRLKMTLNDLKQAYHTWYDHLSKFIK